jgi:hypothetical protein
MTTNQPGSFNSKSINEIDSWIAYDFEWVVLKNNEKFRLRKIDKNTSGASVPPVFGNEEEYNEIVTFAFEDHNGNKGCLDTTDFQSTKSFLQAIKEKLLQYQYCFAWGSKAVIRKNRKTGQLEGIKGDLVVLDSNFISNKIPSIVAYDKYSSVPYLKKDVFTTGKSHLKADVDLLKVFAKPLVRTSIFKNRYKSLHLENVCKGLLGYGKRDNKTGAKIDEMSVDERKSYCLNDAHLVAELVRVNNGDVLKIMQVIASHTGLAFEEVCHKGMPGIWKKIINEAISKKIKIVGKENIPSTLRNMYSNNVSYGKYADYFDETEYDEEDEEDELLEYKENSYDHYIDLLDQKSRNKTSDTVDDYSDIAYSNNNTEDTERSIVKNKYKGGLVLDPLIGLHHDVYLFDITSLYPTMIINNNISPETVNCSCCKHDINARLVFDKDLLNDLHHGNVIENNGMIYWTCKRRTGLFSKILGELTQKRIQYKKEGKELESTAIKAIINSGYGVFGDTNFKYSDPKVAEVITALGRQTFLDMRKIAIEMNFTVLYGDTDSLFVNNIKNNQDIPKFIDDCNSRLNVTVTHEKTFRKLILVGKKHYIGIPYGDDKPVIKGMEGIKSNRPEFIQTAFLEMIKDIQKDVNPIAKLRKALEELDKRQVPKERLAISLTLSKNPQDYANDCLQKRLGTKLRLKKGDILTYYKSDKQIILHDKSGKQRTKTIRESDDPADISYAKYKEMFINSIKNVIEILGYSVDKDLLAKKKFLQGTLF